MGSIESSPANPLFTVSGTNPSVKGFYVYSIGDVAGVVAANNYLTLFNPVGSGRTLLFGGAFISSHVVGDVTTPSSVSGHRITTATGGTLAVNSTDVAKFQTSAPDPVAELRTLNPTVTLGARLFNSPPIEATAKSGSSGIVHQVNVPPGAGVFSMVPGEGVAIRTAVGDVDQRWNFSIVWGEV